MIKCQECEHKWEFPLLVVNIDAVKIAGSFGIEPMRAVTYQSDETGTRMNFCAVCEAASNIRKGDKLKSDWKRDIENYRNKKASRR